MVTNWATRKKGFSLLELVVVVVIIGIIAAVAIPRLSRGSAGAADAALSSNLAVLRNAIDLYSAEHGGAFPTVAKIEDQLVKYTDSSGNVADAKDATHLYGPYVRKIPALPVGAKKGNTEISDKDGDDVGWIYNATSGDIRSNTTDKEEDEAGKLYSDY
jgi:prepilin-type N-terminal cleavage/methylation domain-containing protein